MENRHKILLLNGYLKYVSIIYTNINLLKDFY